MQGIFKTAPATASDKIVPVSVVANEVVGKAALQKAWDDYTEQRKGQAAEFQLLRRGFEFKHPSIVITLTNPVEESLLDNFRHDFIQYLRNRLNNNEITILTVVIHDDGKKVIYTNKEKFEHMAGTNPYLNELKERLGLDWDF